MAPAARIRVPDVTYPMRKLLGQFAALGEPDRGRGHRRDDGLPGRGFFAGSLRGRDGIEQLLVVHGFAGYRNRRQRDPRDRDGQLGRIRHNEQPECDPPAGTQSWYP